MPVNERTYSFRASGDLAERTREAFRTWDDFLAGSDSPDPSAADRSHQLWLTFVKHYLVSVEDLGDSQSARLRSIAEVFISTAESVAEDRAFVDEYRDWASLDDEGTNVREGALAAAAERWRDE